MAGPNRGCACKIEKDGEERSGGRRGKGGGISNTSIYDGWNKPVSNSFLAPPAADRRFNSLQTPAGSFQTGPAQVDKSYTSRTSPRQNNWVKTPSRGTHGINSFHSTPRHRQRNKKVPMENGIISESEETDGTTDVVVRVEKTPSQITLNTHFEDIYGIDPLSPRYEEPCVPATCPVEIDRTNSQNLQGGNQRSPYDPKKHNRYHQAVDFQSSNSVQRPIHSQSRMDNLGFGNPHPAAVTVQLDGTNYDGTHQSHIERQILDVDGNSDIQINIDNPPDNITIKTRVDPYDATPDTATRSANNQPAEVGDMDIDRAIREAADSISTGVSMDDISEMLEIHQLRQIERKLLRIIGEKENNVKRRTEQRKVELQQRKLNFHSSMMKRINDEKREQAILSQQLIDKLRQATSIRNINDQCYCSDK